MRCAVILASIVSAGLVGCIAERRLEGDGGVDGGVDGGIDPNGTNHTYVVSKITMPQTPNEATMLGLDIDGLANDGIDNNLGALFAAIGQVAAGLDIQGSIDIAVDRGEIIQLVNLKAKALDNAEGVGLWVYRGINPNPPACNGGSDTTCRKHLAGTGGFEISPVVRIESGLVGDIRSGRFVGGPGAMTVQIVLFAGAPIELPLRLSRAQLDVSANGIGAGSKLGGAIAETDLKTRVYPAMHASMADVVLRDCGPLPRSGAMCGCASASTGLSLLGFLDGDDNCNLSDTEVQATFEQLLTLDIDLDEDGANDAVSLGVGVTAVQASFTIPGP